MLLDVHPDKASYQPGDTVRLLVRLASPTMVEVGTELSLVASIAFLVEEVARLIETIEMTATGTAQAELVWMPPPVAPRGYGVDLQLLDGSSQVIAAASTALDVLERWTQAPRYGFLTDFGPDRANFDETMEWLTQYHVNGLQFYDWMYRHDQLLPPANLFDDPLGRRQSLATVKKLIEAAHARSIAAMPYTAIYAASLPFFQEHQDWALMDAEGRPIPFGDDFLMYMNPHPGSAWSQHLLGQFAEVLDRTAFDGIHLDQYGDPKIAYGAEGNELDLARLIPQFIDRTKETAVRARPEAAVTLNCVGNWPIETAAPSRQDFAYIEVWPPKTLYSDLHSLIVEAQALGGKPVVLAAYIDPSRARNVRLADAVIMASGGCHIELGEPGGMLADPYFPNHRQMSDELARALRRYYDFAVRYGNVLALNTCDATAAYEERVIVEGLNTDPQATCDKIWPVVREGDNAIGLSLINLLGLSSPEWNGLLTSDPPIQENLVVRVNTDRIVARVWWATPDGDNPAGQALEFSIDTDRGRAYAMFRIPSLAYWDLIVLELDDECQETA